MADLQAYIGRGGYERGRIMPPSDTLLERNVAPENVKIWRSIVASSGVPILFDDFEYVLGRAEANATATATVLAAGWTGLKSQNDVWTGASGWIYTVTSIPGYAGAFPGGGSRVLCLESQGETIQQTDFYLSMGNASDPEFENYIPANVWFQFWIYPQNFGSQLSTHDNRTKFFYATRGGYPSHTHNWMGSVVYYTNNPQNVYPWGIPGEYVPQCMWNLSSAAGESFMEESTGDVDTADQIGPNTWPTEYFVPNRWTLCKMHMDTSGEHGTFELWLRAFGTPTWTKTMEYISNVTPGFTWTMPVASRLGHRQMIMPSTSSRDWFIYMDDFCMAAAEADLPTYGD